MIDGPVQGIRFPGRTAIEAALRLVNVPYNLSIHLPDPFHQELFADLSQAPTTKKGNTSPFLRVARYSKKLAYSTRPNSDVMYIAETMLQLPHFLHLLRQHPFAGH